MSGITSDSATPDSVTPDGVTPDGVAPDDMTLPSEQPLIPVSPDSQIPNTCSEHGFRSSFSEVGQVGVGDSLLSMNGRTKGYLLFNCVVCRNTRATYYAIMSVSNRTW